MVCVQAGWFIVQCIARVAQGLPLSLLEIHVVAHVFIALLMYLLWFKKPYGALTPLILQDPGIVQVAALFSLGGSSVGKLSEQDCTSKCLQRDVMNMRKILETRMKEFSEDTRQELMRSLRDSDEMRAPSESCTDRGPAVLQEPNLEQNGYADGPLKEQPTPRSESEPLNQSEHSVTHDGRAIPASEPGGLTNDAALEPEDIAINVVLKNLQGPSRQRIVNEGDAAKLQALAQLIGRQIVEASNLADQAIARMKSRQCHFPYYHHSDGRVINRDLFVTSSMPEFGLENEVSSLSFRHQPASPETSHRLFHLFYSFFQSEKKFICTFILFIFYGAFHLSAWNSYFPTTIERWIWRGSGLLIAGFPLLSVVSVPSKIFETLQHVSPWSKTWKKSSQRRRGFLGPVWASCTIIILPCALASLAATVALVIGVPCGRL